MEFITANLDAILYFSGLIVLLFIFMPFSPMLIDIMMLPRHIQIGIYRHRRILWTIVWACAVVVAIRGLNAIGEPSGLLAPITGILKTALGGWAANLLGTAGNSWLQATVITGLVMTMMFWMSYVPYVMTPPTMQKLLDPSDTEGIVADDDMVLGIVGDGEARAYKRDAIARPHFFNDTVGDNPLMISYCILCNSAMAFVRELDGKAVDMKCVTAFNNNIIYYDKDTGNYIQQIDGVVFYGPDTGKQLKPYPVVQATWGNWKKLHPDTKYFHAPSTSFRDKMMDVMLQWMIPIRKLSVRKKPYHRILGKLDKRLPAMSYVYAVELGDERKGYAESDLANNPVVNDTVGGQDIVVLYDKDCDVGAIFSRSVGGRTLNFSVSTESSLATDNETGSSWDVTGRAVAGELAGTTLEGVPHFNKLFWFSWPLFKPDTALAGAS